MSTCSLGPQSKPAEAAKAQLEQNGLQLVILRAGEPLPPKKGRPLWPLGGSMFQRPVKLGSLQVASLP